jgi:hypothetical protein
MKDLLYILRYYLTFASKYKPKQRCQSALPATGQRLKVGTSQIQVQSVRRWVQMQLKITSEHWVFKTYHHPFQGKNISHYETDFWTCCSYVKNKQAGNTEQRNHDITTLDLTFSLRCVVGWESEVSEQHIASIFRVEDYVQQEIIISRRQLKWATAQKTNTHPLGLQFRLLLSPSVNTIYSPNRKNQTLSSKCSKWTYDINCRSSYNDRESKFTRMLT